MSKTVLIDNRILNDSWFYGLSVESKFLFLFLLLNDACNVIGCYEIPEFVISTYTGISPAKLKIVLQVLSPKVIYHDGWVIIKNYCKYNPMRNPNIEKAKENLELSLPEEIKILRDSLEGLPNPLKETKDKEKEKVYINNNIEGVGDQGLTPVVITPKSLLIPENTAKDIDPEILAAIDDSYIEKLSLELKVPISFVVSKLDDINTYIKGYRGKRNKYTNFKMVLKNWVKRDAIKASGFGKADPMKRGIDATNL